MSADPARYCTYTSYDRREEPTPENVPATGAGAEGLAADVWDALYGVEDPEMPVSVVDLGLVYGLELHEPPEADGAVARVDMTLTYTGCPARDMLTGDVERAVAAVDGVAEASVNLVWSPEWSVDLVTDDGEESLREFGLSV